MTDEGATAEGASEDLSTLVSSTTLMLFVGSLGSVSMLLERILIGRLLTPEAYGTVSVLIAVMNISVTVGMVGFKQGIPRYMSRFDDERDTRGAWISGVLVSGVAAVVITLVLLANASWVQANLLEPGTPTALLVLVVLAIPFTIGLELAVSVIRGHENTIYRTYTRDLLYNGIRIVLIAALLVLGVGIVAVGYAYVLSAVVALIGAAWLLNKLQPLAGEYQLRVREMTLFSVPLVLSATVSVMLGQMDTVMLGYFLPSADVGVYNAAYPIAQSLGVVASSFGFMFLPLMSRLDADGKVEEIDHLYATTTKWIFVITFPALLCLVAFPDDLLLAFFGAEYTGGATSLVIIAIGFFTSQSVGRCQDALSAFGYTNHILVINTVAAALNFVLNIGLIIGYGPFPQLGIEGAALASAISYVSLNWLALGVLWYETGVTPISRWSVRAFVLLPVTLFPPALLLAQQVTLSFPALVAFVPVAGIAAIVVLAVTNSLQPDDEIPVELVEDNLGFEIPLIRRYIPDE